MLMMQKICLIKILFFLAYQQVCALLAYVNGAIITE